ncbi:MAG: methylmalonyl-CoA mutase family protein [Candidatus Eisenbacteria sp.]|nr:methylmalonyl-CoA mutase family protein [Candidatus Eisenbacteria bacterium]
MFDSEEIKRISGQKKRWQKDLPDCSAAGPFETVSGAPVEFLCTPEDVRELDYTRDLGFPGMYPYTRGAYGTMYRGRQWTMRQFSGFGSAADTNRRFHFLLEKGQTGLSTAFDMPTIMGFDSDHARSLGEVGKCGVAIDSLEDMETLFRGIPLDRVSTSMTINAPAAILLALYIAVGEKQGVPSARLQGTIQNDILKEYMAQKSWIFPPGPSMRIITDILAFCTEHVPKWNTISISGYHIREAGSTALQELAFTLADGFAYVEAGIAAGLDVDDFAPRLSHFFNAHLDFFEEIAKYRAARRIWARHMKEKYGAKKPESLRLRFHTQTAGCSLTAQQPENNIVRTAFEALSAVLGGTQSLHTNSMDETLALPSEKAVTIALRTQQIIASETGVANTVDPLAGSYLLESLTSRLEQGAEEYFRKIESLGGVIAALEKGFFQTEISRAAYRYQLAIEKKARIVVGVNEYVQPDENLDIDLLEIDRCVEEDQVKRLKVLRERRDNGAVGQSLEALRSAAGGSDNMMPRFLDCARCYATEGEIIDVLREEFGEYKDPKFF